MESRQPRSCSAGQRPCSERSKHAMLVLSAHCENQWLQKIVGSQKLTDILRGTGVWLREGKRGTVFSIMEILRRQRAAPKTRAWFRRRPKPSFDHVWRRLSNITWTNVRGRRFPGQLLSSEFRRCIHASLHCLRAAVYSLTKQTVEH